jgi:hypothetical protein
VPEPVPLSSTALSVKLGFLSCGGIYCSPILEVGSNCSPVVSGLQVSNLSMECQQPPGQPASLVVRFWADQPGPFETSFVVHLPEQQQEVGGHRAATDVPAAAVAKKAALVTPFAAPGPCRFQQLAGLETSHALCFYPSSWPYMVRGPAKVCSMQVSVHVTATVMPRNKGTPGLKPSVHCVGFTCETDTEAASDWQGFD